jgi:imidazole glycerol-phosphate synthase subunit HisF
MLRPRLIPCLLIHNGGLVKTVQFGNPKYVGDPLNAVRIFNEKEVDELMVIDIDASRHGVPPNEKLIAEMAAECRMPLCYGGGVKSADMIDRLVSLGVEKIAVSSAAIENNGLITEAARRVGNQSIVVVIDVKSSGILRRQEVVTYNGAKRTGLDPVTFARQVQDLGAGEIVINSVDRDGKMQGYDLALAAKVRAATSVPLTIIGGAGTIDDVRALIAQHPVIGAAAGSLFVFKGKFRAVLINYPGKVERDLLGTAL